MADAMTYAFVPRVTNGEHDNTQNITGLFGVISTGTFTEAACPSGTLCKQASSLSGMDNRIKSEGYGAAGIYNENSWKMVAADDGAVSGLTGDATGIYACNTYNVNQASDGNVVFNFAGKTLGLTVPAGERSDFTQIKINELYLFGYLNTSYSGTPDTGAAVDSNFAPGTVFYITDGKLTPTAGAGSRTGELAFEVLDGTKIRFSEGPYDAGRAILVRAIRVPAA